MNRLLISTMVVVSIMILAACSKESVSRDELSYIKETITAVEDGIKARSVAAIDTLMSAEAAPEGVSPQSVLDFVYSDGASAFTGFINKQIVYRGDAARVDCAILDSDSANRPVTLTLKKENGFWRLKKIVANAERAFPIEPDSNDVGGSPE